MSDYIIATSSTSDLPRTWLEEHNIPFIAYSYTVNDEPREDDCREETRAAVYAGMRRGDKLHTSMINEFVYYDFLKTFLDEGKDRPPLHRGRSQLSQRGRARLEQRRARRLDS